MRLRAKRLGLRGAIAVERRWDAFRLARAAHRRPEHLRIVPYLGHAAGGRVVVRGRVVDDPEPPPAVEGEGTWDAVRRTIARFSTDELPGVRLRVRVGSAEELAVTDDEGYFELRLAGHVASEAGWAGGEVALAAPYRGVAGEHATPVRVRVPGASAAFGVVSDVDDTILHTGAQRAFELVRRTLTGSALTRTPFTGAPELYRALAARDGDADANPVFYVSSSPWNLHDFLVAFLEHRGFPAGPLLLRDLLGSDVGRTHASTKHERIAEVLDVHAELPFVLVGDSGQHDPEIYADVVRRYPGRILAVYIREVRLDPGDGRVETVGDSWASDVPFVLAADSAAVARHAAGLGLVSAADAELVERVVARRTG